MRSVILFQFDFLFRRRRSSASGSDPGRSTPWQSFPYAANRRLDSAGRSTSEEFPKNSRHWTLRYEVVPWLLKPQKIVRFHKIGSVQVVQLDELSLPALRNREVRLCGH